MTNNDNVKQHHGRNIKRLREIRGIKQEAFAAALGKDWNQSKVSYLEGRDTIEDELLAEVAKILNVPVEAIQNLPESIYASIISPVFNDSSGQGWFSNFPTFHFNNKIIELFERLLISEQEKRDMLQKRIEDLEKKAGSSKRKKK